MSALLSLQLCVCDSDSEYEYGDAQNESTMAKPMVGDVSRSEQLGKPFLNSGSGQDTNSFQQQAPTARLQAMKMATREASASNRSHLLSPSPSFLVSMTSFSKQGAPAAPRKAITSMTKAGSQSPSYPLQRSTSGSSQLSLAHAARAALHCTAGSPSVPSSTGVGRRTNSSKFCAASPNLKESRQVLSNTQIASPRSSSFSAQPTSPRGSHIFRQTSNPSIGIGSPRGSFAIDSQSYQRLHCNSFSSTAQVRGRGSGDTTEPTSPRLRSPVGRQVSYPSGATSTTLGEVSRQVSVVGPSNSFSSTNMMGSSASASQYPSLGSPRARSPVGELGSKSTGPPSLFWRSDSRALDSTSSPRQSSPPPLASEGFSPFWHSPRGEKRQPSASVEEDLAASIQSKIEPPPGLLGDLLRAVPPSQKPARPKTVFWQPPPEAAAVCGVRSQSITSH